MEKKNFLRYQKKVTMELSTGICTFSMMGVGVFCVVFAKIWLETCSDGVFHIFGVFFLFLESEKGVRPECIHIYSSLLLLVFFVVLMGEGSGGRGLLCSIQKKKKGEGEHGENKEKCWWRDASGEENGASLVELDFLMNVFFFLALCAVG